MWFDFYARDWSGDGAHSHAESQELGGDVFTLISGWMGVILCLLCALLSGAEIGNGAQWIQGQAGRHRGWKKGNGPECRRMLLINREGNGCDRGCALFSDVCSVQSIQNLAYCVSYEFFGCDAGMTEPFTPTFLDRQPKIGTKASWRSQCLTLSIMQEP